MFKLILKGINLFIRLLQGVIDTRNKEVKIIDDTMEALQDKRDSAVSERNQAGKLKDALSSLLS